VHNAVQEARSTSPLALESASASSGALPKQSQTISDLPNALSSPKWLKTYG
jgi:hypothetical protein